MKHINTSRVLLLLHYLHQDHQIMREFAKIVPDFDQSFFEACAFGLQQVRLLQYSILTRRRLMTDKGRELIPMVIQQMKADAGMPDCENLHALMQAAAHKCQAEQAAWQVEGDPVIAMIYKSLSKELQEGIQNANQGND